MSERIQTMSQTGIKWALKYIKIIKSTSLQKTETVKLDMQGLQSRALN